MKTRKLIKGMMAVAIVVVAGLAIYANQSKEHKSDVMLANIEALASGESFIYYRLFPCAKYPYNNECRFSNDTTRPGCYGPTYCN